MIVPISPYQSSNCTSTMHPVYNSSPEVSRLVLRERTTSSSSSSTRSSLTIRCSSDGSEVKNVEENENGDGGGGDDSATTCSSSYLAKDAALHAMNAELEKRSTQIFEKIEKYYANKCGENSVICGSGDAAPLLLPEIEENLKSPPFYKYEDVERSLDAKKDHDFDVCSSDSFPTSVSGATCPSLSSSSSSRSTIIGHRKFAATTNDTQDVDIKARKRLQKATESVVTCLQSKLLSHEGRLAELYVQFRQKIQENTMLEGKTRALEDDRDRLLKSLATLQTATDKATKTAEVVKSNLSLKSQAYAALKRDCDALRRDQKQKSATLQNLQTRLNRSLDECERLKQTNRSLLQNARDKQTEERLLIDELTQKVGQLEQQKSILNATLSKQSALVKTLRQQQHRN
ncbi:Testis-expressed sequence 9 protein [Folsomia candida]|uniref:Testis-expressed sequence 9 protein n=1 Tax=Folsomia candida TaxID=158441 RepID=A0A226EEC2_FOLCA|nr:Testis-expressed sequence 9 protein [Folsomia candida]